LIEFLDVIDYDARRLDANLEEAHGLASDILGFVRKWVSGPTGPLNSSPYKSLQHEFERKRDEENDIYELYAHELERYQEQKKDLERVQARRRAYISLLRNLQAQISGMLDYLQSLDYEMSNYAQLSGPPT